MTGWPWPLSAIQGWMENLWNEVVRQATRVIDALWKNFVDYLFYPISAFFGSFWAFIQSVYNWFLLIAAKAVDLWAYLTGTVYSYLVTIWNRVIELKDYIWTKLVDIRDYIYGKLTDARNYLWDQIIKARDFIWGKLTGIAEYVISGLTPYFNALSAAFTAFGDWLKLNVLDPWSDWLKALQDLPKYLNPADDKFFLKSFGKWLQDFWKWTAEQSPVLLTYLTFSVTQNLFGQIAWIATKATERSNSGIDAIKSYINNLKTMGPEGVIDATISMFKNQSMMRNDAITWTQSLQLNPSLRGLVFDRMFEGGEWQMLLGGLAGGFGMGLVSAAVTKPIAYWFNSVIRPEILDVETLRVAYLREDITDVDVQWGLSHWGFDDGKISTIKKTWKWIPGPSDLIRLAVREAFTPPLMLDYESEDYKKWMRKQGAEEWSDMFWHAHWVLPSITELNEMVHRNIIDDATWKKFVVLNDYWPAMVDNFKKIIYTPYTRVDIRRMYNVGVLDEAGVTKAYKDIGYDEERAKKLTDFTKTLKTGTEKDLTMSMITKSFKLGNISRSAAIDLLVDMGYEEDEADFILDLYEQQAKEESRELSQAKWDAAFQLGLISREELKRNLIALNYSSDAAENLVKIEESKKAGKITMLPLGTLREALRRAILTPARFAEKARKLGYVDEEIEIVIALEQARAAA